MDCTLKIEEDLVSTYSECVLHTVMGTVYKRALMTVCKGTRIQGKGLP